MYYIVFVLSVVICCDCWSVSWFECVSGCLCVCVGVSCFWNCKSSCVLPTNIMRVCVSLLCMLMSLFVCMVVVWCCDLVFAITCVMHLHVRCCCVVCLLLCVVFAIHVSIDVLLLGVV